MADSLEAARVLTKEDVNRGATLSAHTYGGATAMEWQEQADALREGDGGDQTKNDDARQSQLIADALAELDEELERRRGVAMSNPKSDIHLAKLWLALKDVRGKIDNEILPLGTHLGIEDPELMQALENLSERIGRHFGQWHLTVEPRGRARRKGRAETEGGVK